MDHSVPLFDCLWRGDDTARERMMGAVDFYTVLSYFHIYELSLETTHEVLALLFPHYK